MSMTKKEQEERVKHIFQNADNYTISDLIKCYTIPLEEARDRAVKAFMKKPTWLDKIKSLFSKPKKEPTIFYGHDIDGKPIAVLAEKMFEYLPKE